MQNVNYIKPLVMAGAGAAGGFLAKAVGGWSEDLTTLLLFMGVDFVLGLMIAAFWKKSDKSRNGALSSVSAWKGLMRKGGSLLAVLVAHRLDLSLGVDYIRTAVIVAFIVNEAISIVENLGIMGVPMPAVLMKAIDVLKNKSNEN